MNADETTLLVGMIVMAILGLVLAFWLIRLALIGALALLAFAGEQGFVGLAAYVACWVFFFPVMLVICIIVGFFARNTN